MSLIEFGSFGPAALADEWSVVNAQASRDPVTKRTGAASLASDLNVANANGRVEGALHHTINYNVANAGTARTCWPACAFYMDAWPGPGFIPAYGPILNAGAGANSPWTLGVQAIGGGVRRLALYDLGAIGLATCTGPDLALTTWYPILSEWDAPNKKVKVWFWEAGAWVLRMDYTSPYDLWATFGRFQWGFHSLKGGGMVMEPLTDDVWCNSDYDSGDGCKTKPSMPPRIYTGYPDVGVPSHNAFTGNPEAVNKYLNVDDSKTIANDGDTTYNESGVGLAEVKQTHELDDGISPDTDTIQGVGFCQQSRVVAGSNGACSHLVVADSSELVSDMPFGVTGAYRNYGLFRAKSPAGNTWTAAMVDGMEYGARRASGASAMRNWRVTNAYVEVAEGELEPPAIGYVHSHGYIM